MTAEPCVPSRLDELGDDERLEDAAPEIMLTELVGCLQAELDNLSIEMKDCPISASRGRHFSPVRLRKTVVFEIVVLARAEFSTTLTAA